MSRAPALTGWALSTCMAIALAGSVYRMPIQVDEALEVIVRTSEVSVGGALVDSLHNSHTTLRPMRDVQAKLLGEFGAMVGNYHVAFRGYHAGLVVLLVLLFTYLADVRTWPAVAALAVGLTVLTGLHTFQGLLREAYPVNHFLLIAVYGLLIVAIGRSRGGWWADTAAAAVVVLASMTLEAGLLLLPMAVAGYIAGLRGISTRGLIGLVAVTVAYVALRTDLGIAGTQLGERGTGFGTVELSGEEQISRFSQNPLPFYLYNAGMAALTVLLSQPESGQWTIVQAWHDGQVTPVFWVTTLSSLAMTTVIGWFLIERGATGRRRWREPLGLMFLVLLIVNAAMSYAYSKSEIVSLSGCVYALVACMATAELIGRARTRRATAIIAVVMMAVSSGWAIRSAGLQFKLRQAAVNARGGWAAQHPPPSDALVSQLKQESLFRVEMSATRLPPRYQRWWGQE